jgi:hypothetical protein
MKAVYSSWANLQKNPNFLKHDVVKIDHYLCQAGVHKPTKKSKVSLATLRRTKARGTNALNEVLALHGL